MGWPRKRDCKKSFLSCTQYLKAEDEILNYANIRVFRFFLGIYKKVIFLYKKNAVS